MRDNCALVHGSPISPRDESVASQLRITKDTEGKVTKATEYYYWVPSSESAAALGLDPLDVQVFVGGSRISGAVGQHAPCGLVAKKLGTPEAGQPVLQFTALTLIGNFTSAVDKADLIVQAAALAATFGLTDVQIGGVTSFIFIKAREVAALKAFVREAAQRWPTIKWFLDYSFNGYDDVKYKNPIPLFP